MFKSTSFRLKTVLCILLMFVSAVLVSASGVLNRNNDTVEAAPSTYLNFQARLKSNGGSVVPDGYYNIEFKIYDDDSGGSLLWTETRTGGNRVRVANGYMTVSLGSISAFPDTIQWGEQLWLSMNIGGSGSPDWDGEMTPRLLLTAVPHAFMADKAKVLTDGTNDFTASSFLQSAPNAVQAINSSNTAIRVNQTGAGNLLQLQSDNSNILTVSKTGTAALTGSLNVSGNSSIAGASMEAGTVFGADSWRITGTSAANGLLILTSTSHSTKGSVVVTDQMKVIVENKTITDSSFYDLIQVGGGNTTLTLNDSLAAFRGIVVAPTVVYQNNWNLTGGRSFEDSAKLKNVNGVTKTIPHHTSFFSNTTVQGDGAQLTSYRTGFLDNSVYSTINGGTVIGQNHMGFDSQLTVNSGATVVDRYGYRVRDFAGTGAVTTQYGVHVGSLTGATSNYGVYIQNASTYSLWVDDGITRLDGNLEVDTNTLYVDAVNHSVGVGTSTIESGFKLQVGDGTGNSLLFLSAGDSGYAGLCFKSDCSRGLGYSESDDVVSIQLDGNSIVVSAAGFTTGRSLYVGVDSGSDSLLVLDTKTTAGDPTGTNGAMYYNSDSGKLRMYQNGAWTDIGDISNGGNSKGSAITLGTNDAYALNFETSGSNRLTIASGGNISIGTASDLGQLAIVNDTAADLGLVVRGASSQSGNLQEWQNNSGTALASISSAGNFSTSGTATVTGNLTVDTNTLFVDAAANRVGIGNTAPSAALEVSGDIYLTKEVARTIKLANSTTASTAGATLSIVGANGGSNAAGGAINITAGQGQSAVGGNINITAGQGAFNTGGNVNIIGGAGINAGSVNINSGTPSVGTPGSVVLQSSFTVAANGTISSTNTSSVNSFSYTFHSSNTNAQGMGVVVASTASNRVAFAAGGGSGLGSGLVVMANGFVVVGSYSDTATNRLNINTLTVTDSAAQLAVSTNGTTNKGIIVQGVASQTADLFQAQNSAGTTLVGIGATGSVSINSGNLDVAGSIAVGSDATASASRVLNVEHMFSTGADCIYGCMGNTNLVSINDQAANPNALVGTAIQVSTEAGSLTLGQAVGLGVNSASAGAGTTITENYGILIANQTAGASNYGLYIQGASTYALFVDDGATRLDGTLEVGSTISYSSASADTSDQVCRNSSGQLAGCTSASRYKDNVQNLYLGLNELRLLQPVSYTWNTTGKADIGFLAEQVASVIPQAVTYDEFGRIASFNYNTISALLVSGVKEMDLRVTNLDARLAAVEQGNFANISVSGNLTVGGVAQVQGLRVNGKIVTGGSTPTVSYGGGSGSANGNDIAGTISFVPASNGLSSMQMSVSFASSFASQPRVTLTPASEKSGSIKYYIERTVSGFTIKLLEAPEVGGTYSFDYQIMQ